VSIKAKDPSKERKDSSGNSDNKVTEQIKMLETKGGTHLKEETRHFKGSSGSIG